MMLLIKVLVAAGSCIAQADTTPVKTDSVKTTFRVERKPAESYMLHQVSHISEFVKRFNGEAPKGVLIDSAATPERRSQKVAKLFDQSNTSGSTKNTLLQKRKSAFLEAINNTDKPLTLAFPSDDMFATVSMEVMYAGSPQTIKFALKAFEKDSTYDWKILTVTVPFAMTVKAKSISKTVVDSTNAFIPLNAQETSFLALFNHIRDRKNLLAMAAGPVADDSKLTQFSQLVQQGKIVPTHTEQPIVWLETNDTWLMQLEYRNRESLNSGWLITGLFWLPGGDANQLPKEISSYLTAHKP